MKKLVTIIAYIIFVIGDLVMCITSHVGFMNTYGDKAFSKGFAGFMVHDFAYVVLFIIATFVAFHILKSENDKTKNKKSQRK